MFMLASSWTSIHVLPVATFHAKGKFDLTILEEDSRIVYITWKCLTTMFGFFTNSIHVFMDVVLNDNKKATRKKFTKF